MVAVKKTCGRHTPFRIIQEYGSGLNANRPGLRTLIRAVQEHKVSQVFITYADRLTRFGFTYLHDWFAEYRVPICEMETQHSPPSLNFAFKMKLTPNQWQVWRVSVVLLPVNGYL